MLLDDLTILINGIRELKEVLSPDQSDPEEKWLAERLEDLKGAADRIGFSMAGWKEKETG